MFILKGNECLLNKSTDTIIGWQDIENELTELLMAIFMKLMAVSRKLMAVFMKKHVHLIAPALLSLSVVGWLPPALGAVVIQYHHISDDTPPSTSTSPALFARHLELLKAENYSVVPLHTLTDALQSGEPLPDRAVAITFDDGYESLYSQAYPLLKQYGFPFTVFLNTKPIEQGVKSFVTWEQVREMAANGAAIANHTHSHPHMLRRLEGESEPQWYQRMTDEIQQAQSLIEDNTNQHHRLFVYPYGEYDTQIRALLEDLNFIGFGQQSGPLAANSSLTALPRFPFGGNYGGLDDFKVKVATLPMSLDEVTVVAAGKTLADPLLPPGENLPQLELTSSNTSMLKQANCFASGEGAIHVSVDGNHLTAVANTPLPVGRSRYNCTAPSGQPGRFYWYSQQFIRKNDDGSWYPEP